MLDVASDQPDEQVVAATDALASAEASRLNQPQQTRASEALSAPSADADDQSGQTRRKTESDDLQDSLTALSGLSSGDLGLEDLLRRVATFAVRAIPGAEGAGLTLLEQTRRDTVVATDPFVTEIDDIQYRIGEGPCIDAVDTASTLISGSLGGDHRWPRFGGHIARLGVHSALSLPLVTPEGAVGAMNVYAHAKHVFDERAAELGQLFSGPAAIAVQNAHSLATARRLADRLRDAAQTQSIIDQAIGIMIARGGGTPTEARDRLRALSQDQHRKLADVAGRIVDEAVRRAQARRSRE